MKNVTVAMPEALARWALARAEQDGKSLSAWISEQIEAARENDRGRADEQARLVRRILDEAGLDLAPRESSSRLRDELYEERLSRHERPRLP